MSVPLDQLAALFSSGQATMTPQDAAANAQIGAPFAFPSNPANLTQFEASMAPTGDVIPIASGSAPGTTSASAATTGSANNAGPTYGPNGSFSENLGHGIYLSQNQSGQVGVEKSANAAKQAANTKAFFSWLDPSTWGNAGLIAVGVILAIGALLISQKQTIIKVGDTAAKTAALIG